MNRALDEINDLIGKIPFYSRLAASAWEKIGSGHTGLEEYDEAIANFQQSLIEYCHTFSDKNVENNPLFDELLSTYYYLPKILQQKAELQLAYAIEAGTLDDLKLSLDAYKLLVQLVGRDRKRYLAKKAKLFLLSQAKPAFEGAIGTALSLYDQMNASNERYTVRKFGI